MLQNQKDNKKFASYKHWFKLICDVAPRLYVQYASSEVRVYVYQYNYILNFL